MEGNVLPWWSNLWCMQQTVPFSLDTSTLSALEILNKLVLAVDNLISDGKLTAEQIAKLQQQMQELDTLVKNVASGDYVYLYLEQIENYINNNLINFVARLAFYVFPTLIENTDGAWHYAIKVPSSWKQLKFRWIWNETDNTWLLGLAY